MQEMIINETQDIYSDKYFVEKFEIEEKAPKSLPSFDEFIRGKLQ